ncbi:4-diphosphocytidyl-2-C-methyl-D-erythritol kinase [Elysia marginata]|uniref:4-diphosphocytidyl-2-C-methyl-D-erythritol kinase n=1 Tax=Elysia marginata TaxID=1093978 RepID=A0AAV4HPB1_9GAST|nr:4-diphosphocytidyl-2-C-methyl-D-erythritol kinase [Elysia marginata]
MSEQLGCYFHTFLPCDRVFGVLEKKIRRIERIYSPDEHHNIFLETGKLYKVSKDWPVYNFKAVSDLYFKRPLPIKIQESKRFFLTRSRKNTVKIQAEANFRNMLNDPETITKKGHGFTRVPQRVPMGVPVNAAKKSDIRKLLLEHAGEGWEADARFSFLLSVVSENEHSTTGASSSHRPAEESECECLSKDPLADRI